MSFGDRMGRVRLRIATRHRNVLTGVVEEATRAIVEGSEITGSPGQPVDTGNLKASWQTVYESENRAVIGTNVEYARAVEDGIGPHGAVTYGAKNGIGGSHSVRQLVVNWDRVVAVVQQRARGQTL
jgi:phage gpG-like protein